MNIDYMHVKQKNFRHVTTKARQGNLLDVSNVDKTLEISNAI